MNTLQLLSLLLIHVYRNKGWRRCCAHLSQSQLIPRIASKFGLYERPIGFKNIAEPCWE